MSWQHHFNRARQSMIPVAVGKNQVGPIPPGFQSHGLKINGLWGVYEQHRGGEKIRITELPGQYRVSVSDTRFGTPQIQTQELSGDRSGYLLKGLAGAGLIVGTSALGKALSSSQSSTAPAPKQAHRVFISHSWAYEGHLEEIKDLLDRAPGFKYFDHSVSSDDPIDAQLPNHLRKEIRDQMRSTSVVLVLAGMYVAHSDWIQEEIEMATEMDKPIVGVIPSGNERVPAVVQENAIELVNTDGSKVLDAIERHAT